MREAFLTLINPDSSVLEIGPFTRPSIKGPKIKYFDLLDTNDLFDQAQLVGYEINEPPEIHYISPDGDLAVIPDTFQAVVSVAFRTIA